MAFVFSPPNTNRNPYDIRLTRRQLSLLNAKKKKSAGSAAAKKIQVKLLQHVAGTGQAGEVVRVTPPFFNNKLRPTKLAVIISDEQVAQEQKEANEKSEHALKTAKAVKGQLENLTLKISRKAGPDGKLYGGIGAKVIVEELQKVCSTHADYLGSKSVKIVNIADSNGKKMRGDIKTIGEFGATLSLAKDISAKIDLIVETADER